MRYFPGAARPRSATSVVAGLLSLALLAVPLTDARADDHPAHHRPTHHELTQRGDAVHGQIRRTTSDVDDASRAFVRATRAAKAARLRLAHARSHSQDVHDRLGAARTRAASLQSALADSRTRLAAATTALQQGRQALDDQRSRVKQSVVGVLTDGDPSLTAFGSLIDAGSVDDVMRVMSAQTLITAKDDDLYTDLDAAEQQLSQKQDDVAAATRAVATKTTAAKRQLGDVRDLYAQAQSAKQAVQAQVASRVSAKQHALAVRHRDRAALARLREREAGIKHRILALARAEARQHGQQGGYQGAANGFLDYPAAGYPITSPYGYRVHPIYGYYSLHNGDDFGVPCGTQLHAAAAGTVVEEYYDQVWGNRILLNLGQVNGHNMTVIYNHMSKFFSTTGEHVARGQVIGLSGTTGWSTGCHLHFTVMVDGVAVDPMKFL